MNPIAPESIKTVAVIALDHIGDVVLSTPVFAALRRHFPGVRITAIIGPWAGEVLNGNPNVDEVIHYCAEWQDRNLHRFDEGKHQKNHECLARLLAHPFDLVINLRNHHFNLFLGNLLAGRHILSYVGNGSHRLLVNHPVERPELPVHALERNARLLAAIGVTVDGLPEVFPSEKDEAWAEKKLAGRGPWVALAPGTGWPGKRWPEDRFIKLGVKLASFGLPIVVLGGAAEMPVAEELERSVGALNLCGQTTILSLAAVLRRVAVVVNADSAVAHIGACMGTYVVDIIQPHVVVEFAPATDRLYLLTASSCKNPCGGWDFGFDPKTPIPPCACVHSISVDEVKRAVCQALIHSYDMDLLKSNPLPEPAV